MLKHHIQKTIVKNLGFQEKMRFTDLKPSDLENKLFDYHLKITISDGLVMKDKDGLYSLTADGRRIGSDINQKQLGDLDKADSTLFLLIRRKEDGAWLIYKRLTHPLFNRIGFMHTHPDSRESSLETASRVCFEKSGVKASFKHLGAGYFRIFEDSELESFTNFTLLVCEDAEGIIDSGDEMAEYFWELNPDFSDDTMLPNMPTLFDLYEKGDTFFIEKSFKI